MLRVLATLYDGLAARYRFWIPALAGSEWGIRVACDPPRQQLSHAGDENIEVDSCLNVIPDHRAGRQSAYGLPPQNRNRMLAMSHPASEDPARLEVSIVR